MRYPTMWQQAAAPGGRTGIVAILLSAAMLLPVPAARAADQPSPAGETTPAVSGPLTPVHRDSPNAAERPAAKPPSAAKAPAAAAATTAPSAVKPEASTPKPPRKTAASAPATKPAAPAFRPACG